MGEVSESVVLQRGSAPPAGFLERMMPKEYLHQLMAAKGQVSGERRIVSILFFDIADSTRIAETHDPEDVMEIMNGAFEVLVEPIYRYEGTLARLMGDGILSFFGAPIAHEDDPVRACHAALEIVERAHNYSRILKRVWGIKKFDVRVGINTGLVVVGEVGADLRVEYTAMGDAVNLAARMESAAEPGSVLITDNTKRLVDNVFETEDLGRIQVKGKTDPVQVYRLAGQDDVKAPAKHKSSLQSPLVGREHELAFLRDAIETLGKRTGAAVSIEGETGLGKTRLVAEARRSLPDAVSWVEGWCSSYTSTISYWIIRDIMRGLLGVELLSSPDDVEAALRKNLKQLHAEVGEADEEAYPYLARLMDLPPGEATERERAGADEMRRRISRAFCRYVRLVARVQPIVLACENLHWADPYSLEILEALLPVIDQEPLLLLMTFRPGDEAAGELLNRTGRSHVDRCTALRLEPLDRHESVSILQNLVDGKKVPEEVLRVVLGVAEGNAFFLVEVFRALIEAGVVIVDDNAVGVSANIDRFDIPTTVHGAIMSRVDRLMPRDKRTLQTASVIGRAFPQTILSRVMGGDTDQLEESLEELQRRDFVRERPILEPAEGSATAAGSGGGKRGSFGRSRHESTLHRIVLDESVYIFNHSMTAEVVYDSLLKSQRKEFHGRAGLAFEKLFANRLAEAAGLLAYHFELGDVADKAFAYMVKAARRAARVYAGREAVDRYRRALEFGTAVSDSALAETHEELGDVHLVMSEYAAAMEQFDAALKATEDRSRFVTLNRKKGQLCEKWGKYEEAKGYFETALENLRGQTDKAETAFIYSGLGMVLYHSGELDDAVDQVKLARKMLSTLGNEPGVAEACNNLGVIYCKKGDWGAAVDHLDESLSIWENIRDSYGLAASHNNLGLVFHRQGDLDRSVTHFQRSLELFDQIGNLHGLARTYDNLGQVYLDKDEQDKAMEYVKKAVAILAEISVDKAGIVPEMWQSGMW